MEPFLLIIALASTIQSIVVEPPIVTTSYGKFRGKYYAVPGKCSAELYKRIPYAKPPIGDLRWKKPQKWSEKWKGERDASFIGPACAEGVKDQFPRGGYSEDCLHINVYTSTECRKKICPVIYLIHGGRQIWDSAVLFKDDYLVNNFVANEVILVTVGYRLSMFGTLALGDENLLPANLALHDAIFGLKFAKEIIEYFGGDKDRITIMGHSSGGSMVMNIAFSPGITPPGKPSLFKNVIAMSGTTSLHHEEAQIANTRKYAYSLKCFGSSDEIMQCLRNKTTLELCKAQHDFSGENIYSSNQIGGLALAGELFPMSAINDFFQQPAKFRYLTGTVFREVDLVQDGGDNANFLWDEFENPAEVREKNHLDIEHGRGFFEHKEGSVDVFTSVWRTAAAQVDKAGGETYLYEYEYKNHSNHADDLSYIIGVHGFEKDENEKWLSRVYPVYFANFAKGMPPAPDWKPLGTIRMNYYAINKTVGGTMTPGMKNDYHRDLIEYWVNEMMEFDRNVTMNRFKMINQPVQYHLLPTGPRTQFPNVLSDIWNMITSPDFWILVIVCTMLILIGVFIGRCSKKTYNCEYQPLLQHKIY